MAKDTRSRLPKIPPVPEELITQRFPSGFTARDEPNAPTAYDLPNGPPEDLHAGKSSPLLEDPSAGRITDDDMRLLMITASEKLAELLQLRTESPEEYTRFIQAYNIFYCQSWARE